MHFSENAFGVQVRKKPCLLLEKTEFLFKNLHQYIYNNLKSPLPANKFVKIVIAQQE